MNASNGDVTSANETDAANVQEDVASKGGKDSGSTPAADVEFKAITSQEEFERALGKRLDRERSKYSDYSDLQSKAARLDEIEQANKSELERVQDSARAAEVQRDEALAQGARLRVALEHGLSKEDAEHLDDLSDEEAMHRLASRLAEKADAKAPRVGIQVDHSGTQTTHPPSKDDAARQFFGI